MKVDIDDVEHLLNKYQIDKKVVVQIVEDAKQAAEDAKADAGDGDGAGAGKKTKYKYLIVASDPDGLHPQLENIPMWVLKVPEEEQHTGVLDRLIKGFYAFNSGSRKGRKNPIKSVGDGIQAVGTKFYKPAKSPIVTKEPVIILVTDNKVPSAKQDA